MQSSSCLSYYEHTFWNIEIVIVYLLFGGVAWDSAERSVQRWLVTPEHDEGERTSLNLNNMIPFLQHRLLVCAGNTTEEDEEGEDVSVRKKVCVKCESESALLYSSICINVAYLMFKTICPDCCTDLNRFEIISYNSDW